MFEGDALGVRGLFGSGALRREGAPQLEILARQTLVLVLNLQHLHAAATAFDRIGLFAHTCNKMQMYSTEAIARTSCATALEQRREKEIPPLLLPSCTVRVHYCVCVVVLLLASQINKNTVQ